MKKNILSKVLETLEEQNIPVEKIYMNTETRNLFTTGNEPVEIEIDEYLVTGKFVYQKKGQEYNSNNHIKYKGRWGGQDIFSQFLCSHKRQDSYD